jgi:1,4-dihydroxy-2-naphthoate octaprenyltransferase
MDKKPFSPATLFQITQPLQALIAIFTYALGLGIVDYLGKTIQWSIAILGSILIAAMIAAWHLLTAYFHYPAQLPVDRFNRRDGEGNLLLISTAEVPRIVILETALITLALGATVTVLLIANGAISLSSMLILLVSIILATVDFLPPIELCKKGYTEIIEAFLLVNISPALALLIQIPEAHILLVMLTLPLMFVYLAYRIAVSFEYFDHSPRQTSCSMIGRIGWQRCVVVHNLSILFAFLLIAAFLLFGLPWLLAWPIFLALPLGLLQIFQMIKLADGSKPNWKLLWVNSLGTFLILVYLISFTLWVK